MRLLRRHRCHATLTSGATHQMASWTKKNPSNLELNLHQRTTIKKVTLGYEKCKTSVICFIRAVPDSIGLSEKTNAEIIRKQQLFAINCVSM